MSGRVAAAWERWVLPTLVEKACRGTAILEERRRIVPRARGRVLEVGVGSGLNLPFYDQAQVESLVAIDPSEGLLAKAKARAKASPLGARLELVRASAEELPVATASIDSVIMTYTLCSVAEPRTALREIARVLRPGGSLFFVEHGLANEPSTARWQRRITPLWRRVSGNCHLDRDAAAALREADFELPELAAGYTDGVVKALSYTFEGVAVRRG
jgi:ubiquinone/menaquinone biosynthesis C-methylase UbiE